MSHGPRVPGRSTPRPPVLRELSVPPPFRITPSRVDTNLTVARASSLSPTTRSFTGVPFALQHPPGSLNTNSVVFEVQSLLNNARLEQAGDIFLAILYSLVIGMEERLAREGDMVRLAVSKHALHVVGLMELVLRSNDRDNMDACRLRAVRDIVRKLNTPSSVGTVLLPFKQTTNAGLTRALVLEDVVSLCEVEHLESQESGGYRPSTLSTRNAPDRASPTQSPSRTPTHFTPTYTKQRRASVVDRPSNQHESLATLVLDGRTDLLDGSTSEIKNGDPSIPSLKRGRSPQLDIAEDGGASAAADDLPRKRIKTDAGPGEPLSKSGAGTEAGESSAGVLAVPVHWDPVQAVADPARFSMAFDHALRLYYADAEKEMPHRGQKKAERDAFLKYVKLWTEREVPMLHTNLVVAYGEYRQLQDEVDEENRGRDD